MGSKVAEARARPSCPAITTVFGAQEVVLFAWSTANSGGAPGVDERPAPAGGDAVQAIDVGQQDALGLGDALGTGLDDGTNDDVRLGDAVTATEAEPHEVTRMATTAIIERISMERSKRGFVPTLARELC